MEQGYTSKLFYGKYAYKILISRSSKIGDPDFHSGWTVHNCQVWLKENNISHRMYNQVRYKGKNRKEVKVKASLFLTSRQDYDACIMKFGSNVDAVISPYDDTHVDMLKDNTTIVVRSRYLYGKYKYVITFKRHWQQTVDDIDGWISLNLSGTNAGGIPPKWHPGGWNPRLYLTNDADLMLAKLTWGERIKNITVVCTYDELGVQEGNP